MILTSLPPSLPPENTVEVFLLFTKTFRPGISCESLTVGGGGGVSTGLPSKTSDYSGREGVGPNWEGGGSLVGLEPSP